MDLDLSTFARIGSEVQSFASRILYLQNPCHNFDGRLFPKSIVFGLRASPVTLRKCSRLAERVNLGASVFVNNISAVLRFVAVSCATTYSGLFSAKSLKAEAQSGFTVRQI